IAEKLPLLAMSLTVCLVTYVAQSRGGMVQTFDAVPLTHRLANAAVSYVVYISKSIVPFGLAVPYPMRREAHVLLACGAALILIALSIAVRYSPREVKIGWLWFLVTLLPVIGIIQ